MPQPTTSPLQPGDPETVGRFSLAGRLGQGGMGTVYLAHGADRRPVAILVAIKVIRPELAFELPAGTRPDRLVLHDSLLSLGVSIRVRRA